LNEFRQTTGKTEEFNVPQEARFPIGHPFEHGKKGSLVPEAFVFPRDPQESVKTLELEIEKFGKARADVEARVSGMIRPGFEKELARTNAFDVKPPPHQGEGDGRGEGQASPPAVEEPCEAFQQRGNHKQCEDADREEQASGSMLIQPERCPKEYGRYGRFPFAIRMLAPPEPHE
jgi:hypothetical protein